MTDPLVSLMDAVHRVDASIGEDLELSMHENANGSLCTPAERDLIKALVAQISQEQSSCSSNLGPERRLTLAQLRREQRCQVCAASVLDLLSTIADDDLRCTTEKVVRLRGLVPTVTPGSPVHQATDLQALIKLALGYRQYQDIVNEELDDAPAPDNEAYTLVIEAEHAQCLDRLGSVHRRVFGTDEVSTMLAEAARALFGVEIDDTPVVVALREQPAAYYDDVETTEDDAHDSASDPDDSETTATPPEWVTPKRFARTLQLIFAPTTYSKVDAVRVPGWVATAIATLGPELVLSQMHRKVTTSQHDTASKLWTPYEEDLYADFDRCIAAARELCPGEH